MITGLIARFIQWLHDVIRQQHPMSHECMIKHSDYTCAQLVWRHFTWQRRTSAFCSSRSSETSANLNLKYL